MTRRPAILLALAAAFASAAGAAALAQTAPAPQSTTAAPAEVQNRIVVTGRKLRDYVEKFVGQVADPTPEHGYARFESAVCVGVESAPNEHLQNLVDRVSEAALEVGLKTEGPGCQPNILIVFAPNGKALASRLVKERPAMFRPYGGSEGTTHGLAALDAFARSDAPVRWWQVSMPVDWQGRPAIALPQTGGSSTGDGSTQYPSGVMGANSFISSAVRDELQTTYVIVDVGRLRGVTWTQLADYLAMVALAQVDPSASPAAYDTILNLFADGTPPAGMTDWDRSFLHALYDVDLQKVPRAQTGALVAAMTHDRKKAGE
jgi:hypothetical protein